MVKRNMNNSNSTTAVSLLWGAALALSGCAQILSLHDYEATVQPDAGTAPARDAAADADARADAGSGPRIRIVEPASEGIANVPDDGLVTMKFETTGFTLMAAGACGGAPNCGHAHVKIDGDDCDDTARGKAANIRITSADPVKLNMAYCKRGPLGVKTISVELVTDDRAALSPPVKDTIRVNFVRGRVRILDPLDEQIVVLPATNVAFLTFAVSGYAIKPAGECRGMADCGHAHITIDGTDCNNIAAGKAYNIAAKTTEPQQMDLNLCKGGPTGTKVVAIELTTDGHAPLSPREFYKTTVNFVHAE